MTRSDSATATRRLGVVFGDPDRRPPRGPGNSGTLGPAPPDLPPAPVRLPWAPEEVARDEDLPSWDMPWTQPLLLTHPPGPLPHPAAVADDGPRTEPLPPVPAASPLRSWLARRLPVGWRGARLDPGRTGAVVLAMVAALAAIAAVIGVWSERPQVEPVAGLPAVVVDEPPAATTAAEAAPSGPLVISVSGKVAEPGLVQVDSGARVADALTAAGGALPGTDLSGLNLARRLTDGEQIAVGVPPAPDAGGRTAADGTDPGAAPGEPGPARKVDLNTATLAQLDTLPGVGPVTAERIIAWRTANGRFARVEQLREVDGIGEQRFARLRELVTV